MCNNLTSLLFCEGANSENETGNVTDNGDDENQFVMSTTITMLHDNERVVFFILYLIIFSLSMIGNIATLFTTYERKIRLVQKMLIISLALSDITVCVFIGVNNMINFSHPMMNWVLGEFMCSFIPYIQIVGSVANSITMVSIAFDRYINIIHPTSKQWDPNIWLCIHLLIVIWGFSAVVSYPMFTFNSFQPIRVIITDNDNNAISSEILDLFICVTLNKSSHKIFYSTMFSIIFIPLMFAFLWFYYKIAKLIWRQRKLVGGKPNNNNNSVTMETSTDSKASAVQQPPIVTQVLRRMQSNIKTSRTHMKRKIRTFKIILIIMLVFLVCRMPHWIFSMVKFSESLNSKSHWVISNALSLLLILNTTLNPFLYSFLNQTIMYFDKFFISVGDFISNICCCCCTNTEFDDFEKVNPFSPENYNPRPSQSSSTSKQNHVKFVNVAVVNMYPKELSSQNCNTY